MNDQSIGETSCILRPVRPIPSTSGSILGAVTGWGTGLRGQASGAGGRVAGAARGRKAVSGQTRAFGIPAVGFRRDGLPVGRRRLWGLGVGSSRGCRRGARRQAQTLQDGAGGLGRMDRGERGIPTNGKFEFETSLPRPLSRLPRQRT
jgi:hypothetical protein